MPKPPIEPKIYHIVNVDKLASIIHDGRLWSDAVMNQRPGQGTTIGMNSIKQRRLTLPVHCHPGTHVGDYVPFYFCSRSIMLYVIHCANHPELAYRGGQGPIIHLEADLNRVVKWAKSKERLWSFSLSNAAERCAEFRCDLKELDEVNWTAVSATKWSGAGVSSAIREGKQAEFLLYRSFPWKFVERIGVQTKTMAQKVVELLKDVEHKPAVEIHADWYY